MSADLQWMIVRNNSSFLVKRRGARTFTKESYNLKSVNSRRYSGLINANAVGIEPADDGKGVVLVTKRAKAANRPGKNISKVELKKDSRRTLRSIRKTIRGNRYRKDLKMAACRRASAILSSQKPVIPKKTYKKKE